MADSGTSGPESRADAVARDNVQTTAGARDPRVTRANPLWRPGLRWAMVVWTGVLVLLWGTAIVMFMFVVAHPTSLGEFVGRFVIIVILCGLISLVSFLPVLLLLAFLISERDRAREGAEAEVRALGWAALSEEVRNWYSTVFDDRRYGIPVTLALLTFVAGWVFLFLDNGPLWLETFQQESKIGILVDVLGSGPPVSFGLLGGYFFGAWFLFRRYVGGDLGPNAFLHVTVRTWMVAILALVATVALTPDAPASNANAALAVIAFAGALTPTFFYKVILDSMTAGLRTAVRLPNIEASLSEIEGMNPWKAARLVEEGIDNVQNLAMEDPTRLLVVTREGGLRILDWIDQAILVNAVSVDMRQKLKALGIRTAVDLYFVFDGAGFIKRAAGKPGEPERIVVSTPTTDVIPADGQAIQNLLTGIVHHPNFRKVLRMREQVLKAAAPSPA